MSKFRSSSHVISLIVPIWPVSLSVVESWNTIGMLSFVSLTSSSTVVQPFPLLCKTVKIIWEIRIIYF